MNRHVRRLFWTTAVLFGIVFGGLATIAPDAEAAKPRANVVFDVGITGVCRKLTAPTGILVTITNLGTVPASGIVVTGGTAFPGLEYVESFDKPLPVSPLEPGQSVIVRFTSQEIHDQGGSGFLYFFAIESGDARPENDDVSFTSFTQIRPCALNVTPTLNTR